MLKNGGGSWVPLPLGTLAFCANGHLAPSSPPGASTGCGWQGWVGAQEGCVQALQHPGSFPQRPNREELGRTQQKTRRVFFFAHVLYVAVVGSCVCRQRESKLFFFGVSECCWDTESRKLLQEKNQQWIKVLSLSWVILEVTSTCRGSEQAWELSKLPHCWETSFNLYFIFHLRV